MTPSMDFVAPMRTWPLKKWGAAFALCGLALLAIAKWSEIQFELGYAYEVGHLHGWRTGFTRDYQNSAYWLTGAAQAGHPRAQYRLGILHAHGWVVAKNDYLAARWFAQSAQNSYAPACYHLGWMYHKGDGVPRDTKRAIQLLEKSAVQGMAAAHLALGRFYERGEDTPADAIQAIKYSVLAAYFAQSRPEHFDNVLFALQARNRLETLEKNVHPEIAARGRSLAREWLANHPRP